MLATITTLKENFIDMINSNKYDFFVTITFDEFLNQHDRLKAINQLIRFINKKLYGRRFVEHKKFLEGFAFEEHKANDLHYHYHILFKLELKISLHDFTKIVHNELYKVKKHKLSHKNAFNKNCINIQAINPETQLRLINYCSKSIYKLSDTDNILPISVYGL